MIKLYAVLLATVLYGTISASEKDHLYGNLNGIRGLCLGLEKAQGEGLSANQRCLRDIVSSFSQQSCGFSKNHFFELSEYSKLCFFLPGLLCGEGDYSEKVIEKMENHNFGNFCSDVYDKVSRKAMIEILRIFRKGPDYWKKVHDVFEHKTGVSEADVLKKMELGVRMILHKSNTNSKTLDLGDGDERNDSYQRFKDFAKALNSANNEHVIHDGENTQKKIVIKWLNQCKGSLERVLILSAYVMSEGCCGQNLTTAFVAVDKLTLEKSEINFEKKDCDLLCPFLGALIGVKNDEEYDTVTQDNFGEGAGFSIKKFLKGIKPVKSMKAAEKAIKDKFFARLSCFIIGAVGILFYWYYRYYTIVSTTRTVA